MYVFIDFQHRGEVSFLFIKTSLDSLSCCYPVICECKRPLLCSTNTRHDSFITVL